jgi:hypothetical protein
VVLRSRGSRDTEPRQSRHCPRGLRGGPRCARVAELDYENKKLKEVRLIPIVLAYDPEKPLSEQRTMAGVPRLADGKQAKKIIMNLGHLSKLYGTEVKHKDGLGVINP